MNEANPPLPDIVDVENGEIISVHIHVRREDIEAEVVRGPEGNRRLRVHRSCLDNRQPNMDAYYRCTEFEGEATYNGNLDALERVNSCLCRTHDGINYQLFPEDRRAIIHKYIRQTVWPLVYEAITPPEWIARLDPHVFGWRRVLHIPAVPKGRDKRIESFNMIGSEHWQLEPGYVEVDVTNGNVRHTGRNNPPRNLTNTEAKVLLRQLLDSVRDLNERSAHTPLFDISNIVISDGRAKFILKRPRVNYHWEQPFVSNTAVGVSEDRFASRKYEAPRGLYLDPANTHERYVIKCVLLVFELMTGGIPVYDNPDEGNIGYNTFITRRFLSTQPLINFEQIERENPPHFNSRHRIVEAANRIRQMSPGLICIFEAVLLYQGEYRWNFKILSAWLDTIIDQVDDEDQPYPLHRVIWAPLSEMEEFLFGDWHHMQDV